MQLLVPSDLNKLPCRGLVLPLHGAQPVLGSPEASCTWAAPSGLGTPLLDVWGIPQPSWPGLTLVHFAIPKPWCKAWL